MCNKSAENSLRRKAKRQGLRLFKSRVRDDRDYRYGGFMIVDAETNSVMAGGRPEFSMSLDDVAAYLS